jgi:ArsR family transcriptional regulator
MRKKNRIRPLTARVYLVILPNMKQDITASSRYMRLKADIFKALGHPSRLMMVEYLCQGERCVCELQALVGSDMSTVSKHLAVLKEAGVVQDERRGTNIYYRLRMTCVPGFLHCVGNFLGERLEEQIAALDCAKNQG